MRIATKRGGGGQTGPAGEIRVSKTHPLVECYGTIDELISQMGFAPESKKTPPEITATMVDALENPSILYLNRLSVVLWLLGWLVEAHRGVDFTLRTEDNPGPHWSRAW
jgi:cob(I)alamin adenosyltransferase